MTKYNINKPLALYLVIAFYKTIFCTWISIEFISNPCFDKIKDTKLSQLASIQLLFDASIIIFSIINIYKIILNRFKIFFEFLFVLNVLKYSATLKAFTELLFGSAAHSVM